jgi:AraC-like DNA-binding protein
MSDPLAEVVALLQPAASFTKLVSAAGAWRVRRVEVGRPFYGAVLEGRCCLTVGGYDPIELEQGDFVLIPAAQDFSTFSREPSPPADGVDMMPVELRPGEFHIGAQDCLPNVRMLIGYCTFGSADAALLVSLLPQLVHVRGEARLGALVQLVNDEARGRRPGRDVILAHLLEVLLIEALRSTSGPDASPGLVRGLGDDRLAIALRRMHERPTHPWTIANLAKEAALSRSVFFERFRRAIGVAPMEYLLAWRMAMAKRLLQQGNRKLAEIAAQVGYGSAATFSIAFSRHVGMSPTAYERQSNVLTGA